jgi:hypothetical protein
VSKLGPALVALLIAAGALHCDREDSPARRSRDTGLTGGTLIFEDDFERTEPGVHWSAGESNAWRIDSGQLRVSGARNAALWLDVALPDSVRVEFDVTALDEVGDVKFEIFGDGRNHASGYICIYGGWSNQYTVIARLDEHGSDRLEAPGHERVIPERTYRFAAVRTDNRLRWYIDGVERLTYDDAAPLVGDAHRYFAFNNWEAPARFDNVAIYDLGD